MSRNRMVKADFWVSEQIVSCSRDARLLFIGLWCFCDDAGVHPASYLRLRMEVFPGDDCTVDDIKRWIGELIHFGLVREYAIGEDLYWIVTGWKHQKIDKPTYRYPIPQSELKEVSNDSKQLRLANSTSSSRIVVDCSDKASLVVATKEKKGKEKEKKKHLSEVETSPVTVSDCTHIDSHQKLFEYWQTVMNHPRAVLDSKRQRVISKALKIYSFEDLKKAIDGCKNTAYNMGKNDSRQIYDDITLVLRDAEHIERFMSNAIRNEAQSSCISSDDIMAGVI